MSASTPAKKRVRQAKAAVSKAMPLENKNATTRKAVKLGAIGAGAWIAGKAVFSVIRVVVGAALVVAAAAAAATLVPKPVQRQLAGKVRDAALLARDTVIEQAKPLTG